MEIDHNNSNNNNDSIQNDNEEDDEDEDDPKLISLQRTSATTTKAAVSRTTQKSSLEQVLPLPLEQVSSASIPLASAASTTTTKKERRRMDPDEAATASAAAATTTTTQRSNKTSSSSHIEEKEKDTLPSGWIAAMKPTKQRYNGKYPKPNEEEPPIVGYSWDTTHGVWVPSIRFVQETTLLSATKKKKKKNIKKVVKPTTSTTTTKSTSKSAPTALSTSSSSIHATTTSTTAAATRNRPSKKSIPTDTAQKVIAKGTTTVPTKKKSNIHDTNDTQQHSGKIETDISMMIEPTYSGSTTSTSNSRPSRKRKNTSSHIYEATTEHPTPTATATLPPPGLQYYNPKKKKSFLCRVNIEGRSTHSNNQEGVVSSIDNNVDGATAFNVEVDESSPPTPAAAAASSNTVETKRNHGKKSTNDVDMKQLETVEDEVHPNSLWEEPYIDELTLYERHREPRPVPTGTIVVAMDAIRVEIRCAICLDILRNTRIVRECLHRFCESCIEQALTFQNVEALGGRRKECPICRVYIPSRRSLAPDTYMDTMISRLLDNLIWEEDADPKVYLRSPMKLKQSELPAFRIQGTNDDDNNSSVKLNDTMKMDDQQNGSTTDAMRVDRTSSTRQGAEAIHTNLIRADAVLETDDACITPLINVVLIQRVERTTAKNYFPELQQPYITLASDATGSVLKKFLCRKHDYTTTNTTTYQPTDFMSTRTNSSSTTGISNSNHGTNGTTTNRNVDNILLWTVNQEEPYIIQDTDTLHYIFHHRCDPYKGTYMPIYYQYNGQIINKRTYKTKPKAMKL
jgi:Zinc finger, C3HC4 type (RING finger)